MREEISMEVYFVRHGQTEYNKKHLHQSEDVPLNDLGKKQAQTIKELVKKIGPTHIISSSYARAKETAEIACADMPVQISYNDFFIELVRGKPVIGRRHSSPKSIFYMTKWFLTKNEFYSDETRGESRLAFLNRLHNAKAYIESLPNDSRIIVFSHSVFINYFIQHICNEQPISFWRSVGLLMKIKTLANSSFTHLKYDSSLDGGVCKWSVESLD